MNIFGIPRSDWDSKIRLLSASDRVRVITGLKGTKSEREEVVNTVEYNVKPENSAEGLYAQQLPHQEDAQLLPYAEPTHPSERIAFRLVQQALYRHYYLQESDRLSKEEHILGVADRQLTRADGAQVHLRLDQGLDASSIQTLRDLFGSTELGSELQNNAQAIKIAGPNDPFPNEAVYELSLATNSGTRDVIVKAIVPEKSNGPLDEYAALRLLDTLGIPSAKPLARVFLPEDESAGFVVMNKLPGESGRLLEKKLQDRQLPAEKIATLIEQAETMMLEIALRVRNDVGLDKPWRLKDFMVVFNYDDNGLPTEVEQLIPIDFERVHVYSPDNPDEIKA